MKKITDTYFFESFNSVREFANTIKNRPNNGQTENCSDTVFRNFRDKYARTFYGTLNYQDTEKLIEQGDLENYKKLQDISLYRKINVANDTIKSKLINDTLGVLPCVPVAIMKLPKSMINIKRQQTKQKVVNIVVNRGLSYKIAAKDILTAGVDIANLIFAIEKKGIRVNLFVAWYTQSGKKEQSAICLVKVKNATAPLNKLALTYPLVHPSFHRRNFFKWLETFEGVKLHRQLAHGYGISGSCDDLFKNVCAKQLGGANTIYINLKDYIYNLDNTEKTLNRLSNIK